ncbi:hypothetical protein ABZT02_41080 [Streptomyces sp. NPDC005402]|uniref:AraC-like ligand-binding domain-containing protein n=1 Tax=Streptomyces sp. NPDC005402 TaxID=3155338 RepID=UPI0033A9CF24
MTRVSVRTGGRTGVRFNAPAHSRDCVQIFRDQDEKPQGTTISNRFGEVRALLVEGGPREMIRPNRLLESNADRYLSVCRPLAGEILVLQGGKHAAARGAQLVCYDKSRPYKVWTQGSNFRPITRRAFPDGEPPQRVATRNPRAGRTRRPPSISRD